MYSSITWVVYNYNIRTQSSFFKPNRIKLIPNRIRVFSISEPNPSRNKISIPHIPRDWDQLQPQCSYLRNGKTKRLGHGYYSASNRKSYYMKYQTVQSLTALCGFLLISSSTEEYTIIHCKISNINSSEKPDHGVWQDDFRISYDVSGHRHWNFHCSLKINNGIIKCIALLQYAIGQSSTSAINIHLCSTSKMTDGDDGSHWYTKL